MTRRVRRLAPRCDVCGEMLAQPSSALYEACRWPQPVLDNPDSRHRPGFWMSGQRAHNSEAMIVPGVGWFIRAMVPILLDDGTQLTLVPWAAVDEEQFGLYLRARNERMLGVVVEGQLANHVPIWAIEGAEVLFARIRDDDLAFVVATDDAVLRRLLTDRIPRSEAYDLVGQKRPPAFEHRSGR